MIIEYSDFRVSDDETLNLCHALAACHEKKASCLHFQKGVYHFSDEFAPEVALCIANHGENGFKRTAFLLDEMTDFEIDGGGSDFVFDSVMNMVTVLKCRNIGLKNFTVSMPVCPYPEGRVTAVSENSFDVEFSYHRELSVEDNDLLIPNGDRYERAICNIEFNGESHQIEPGTGDQTAGVPLYQLKKEKIAPNTIRFYDAPRIPKQGNVLALMIGRRYVSGLFFDGCDSVTVDNVVIHSCVGIGIMAQCCHNITIRGCSVTAQNGKYVSSGADATHFVSCTGQLTVEDCLFEHMLDDALNVHGVYLKILRSESGKCIVKFCNSATSGIDLFQPGDRVCQMDPHTLIPEKEATVIEVCKINNLLTELTFSEPIKLTEGYIIENLTKYPTLNLRRCIIRNNRARGILIATKHSVIEDCEFHTGGSAIVLECDGVFWYESGAVQDILIRNNLFDRCKHATWGAGVVYIPPREQTVPQKYYHGSITMTGNTFHSCFDDIIYAENAAELVYEDNSSNNAQILYLNNIGKTQLQSEAVLAK